jgi:uncharacterized Zn-binding protein involved in type VI secretion
MATILTVGCFSTHGGVIITGDPLMTINGKPVARIGDLHACPLFYPFVVPVPHAVQPIIPGPCSAQRPTVNGRPLALSGDLTPCGAVLLPCGDLGNCPC